MKFFSKVRIMHLLWSLSFLTMGLIVIGVLVTRGNDLLAPGIQKNIIRSYNKDASRNISIVGDNFVLGGQPLHIVSGSLHYFRLPAAFWRDRLRKLKAAGLNAVSTYVEWSYHEPEERQYRFEGDRDVAAFVRTAAEEGLHVLLRPGPYICAERDLGGLPYWLLGKYPDIKLRSTDDESVYDNFKLLRKFSPKGPLMNSEFYCGWLTYWGDEQPALVRTSDVVRVLRLMLDRGIHINFYVFFGGSNFEYSSGSNYINRYKPLITSYNYDAPLNEAGDPTPKYYAIRNVIKEYNLEAKDFPEPTRSKKGTYGLVTITPRINLLTIEGHLILAKRYQDVTGSTLPYFEKLRQRSGLVLYETKLTEGEGDLTIKKPRDWIYVYVDGELKGTINRMFNKTSLRIQSKSNSVLSLLVENQGRINYGPHLHDRKGVLSPVTYDGRALDETWFVTGYPLEELSHYDSAIENGSDFTKGPILFEGEFTLPMGKEPLDTFLDTTGWGRGYVWVNGNNLGRYWPGIGPQVTLYVPRIWLRAAPATNRLQILELEQAPNKYTMEFIDYPY